MASDQSPRSPLSLTDGLIIAFGLFLLGLSVSNVLAGNYLTAASDGAFGLAGLSIGLRQTLERALDRDLAVMNQFGIGAAALGFVLLLAELFA